MKKRIVPLLAMLLIMGVFSGCNKTLEKNIPEEPHPDSGVSQGENPKIQPSEDIPKTEELPETTPKQDEGKGLTSLLPKKTPPVSGALSGLDASVIEGMAIYFDGKKTTVSKDFFRWEQGFVLVRIAELSELLGYHFGWNDDSFDNGNYYLKNVVGDRHASLTMERRPDIEANSFYIGWTDSEYIFARDEKQAYYAGYYSEMVPFSTDYPLRLVDGVAYLSLDMTRRAFHLQIALDQDQREIRFIREETVAGEYAALAKKRGYDSLSSSAGSALFGYLIAEKGKEENRFALVTTEGKELTKFIYSNITYLPESQQFLVQMYAQKLQDYVVGIIDASGAQVLPCGYDSIKNFDNLPDIFKVRIEDSYGLYNSSGSAILETKYDAIGSSTYSEKPSGEYFQDLEYVIMGDCVTVKKDGKWGIFTLSGEVVLPIDYDSMGLVLTTLTEYGMITINNFEIPAFNAVIVGRNGKYGAINREGRFAVPLQYDRIEYDFMQDSWYGMIDEERTELG